MQNTHNKKNNMGVYTFAACALFFAGAFLYAPHAEAARLYVSIPDRPYGVGDTFMLPLKLDPEGESLNAVSADILFPDEILSVTEVRDNNSPISNWIDAPVISGNSVSFSGIIPGGFDGMIDASVSGKSAATILTLIVHVEHSGSGEIVFENAHAYRNDGQGTEADLLVLPASVTFLAEGTDAVVTNTDTTPPEAFIPVITSSPLLFDGAYTVVFNTTDKGSGIAYYEVSEDKGQWVRATSPYKLGDQTLRSVVRVRAVDHAGNMRLGTVGTPARIPQYVFVLLFLAAVVLLYTLHSRYNKKHKKHKHHQ